MQHSDPSSFQRIARLFLMIGAAAAVHAMPGLAVASESACEEPAWIPTFGTEDELSGRVYTMTVFDDGSGRGPALYVGGIFTHAGGIQVNNIARWDGSSWSPLGSGVNNTVHTLTVFDDGFGGGPALYAGGVFTSASGVAATRVARWDGANWSALGSGMNLTVFALAAFDDGSGSGPQLHAGGWFTTAGGVAASYLARWNGSSWLPLDGQVNNTVRALTVFDDGSGNGPALYAGGVFTNAGGVAVERVARWDGSNWTALGSGLDSVVWTLTTFDDGLGGGPALYAGGNFLGVGGTDSHFIARWNGTSWSPLGNGVNSSVRALTVFDDGSGGGPALYAGGGFSVAGTGVAARIAKWNGTGWAPLGSGVNDSIHALTVFDDGSGGGPALYAGGEFTVSPGGDQYIAKWGCEATDPCEVADFNCDGVVDGTDLAVVLGAWGTCDAPPCAADLNDDGVIDGNDLAILLGAWR